MRKRDLKKAQKKKKLAMKGKAKVAKRRIWIRKQAKEIKDEQKWQRHFEIKAMPFRNDYPEQQPEREPAVTPQYSASDVRKDEKIREKLEHNMEILKALEEEVLAEEAARAKFAKKLEDDGATTMRDKFDKMGNFVTNIAKKEAEAEEASKEEVEEEEVVKAPPKLTRTQPPEKSSRAYRPTCS